VRRYEDWKLRRYEDWKVRRWEDIRWKVRSCEALKIEAAKLGS
jgi:hypothetical protein